MFAHLRRCVLLLIIVAFGAPSCARVRPYYEIEFVTIDRVEFDAPDQIHLEYRTLTETMFHSPGVDVRRNGIELELSPLRVFHEDEGDPDVVATSKCPGLRRVCVPLRGARRVVLTDGIVRRVIWDAPQTSSS